FFFASRRRHTSFSRDWSSDVCSSDLDIFPALLGYEAPYRAASRVATMSIVPARRAARQLCGNRASDKKGEGLGPPPVGTVAERARAALGPDRFVAEDPHAPVRLLPIAVCDQLRRARPLVLLAADIPCLRRQTNRAGGAPAASVGLPGLKHRTSKRVVCAM